MSRGRRTIDGIEVVNAKADFLLTVTEDHVTNGKAMDVELCPGALACMAGMDGVIKSKVYKTRIYNLKYDEDGELKWYMYVVPKSLMIQEAIIDNGGKFQPGKYLIKAPTPSKRVGQGQQGTDTRPPKDPDAPKRTTPHVTPMRVNAPTGNT